MKTTLINTSNLHVGGGVQVATSAISEIAKVVSPTDGLSALLSSEVEDNLRALSQSQTDSIQFETLDVHGLAPFNIPARRKLNTYRIIFTIFGPLYRWRPPFHSVVGFAQPWIIYPHNECYGRMSLLQRLRTRLKFWLQGKFFKRADVLIVELEHVKQGLVRELGIDPRKIYVVHNCLSSLYKNESTWQPLAIPKIDCDLRLGFLGRNYMHKNTSIFPEIAELLEAQHGIKARFYVTFSEAEWQACTPAFRAVCVNVGIINVGQCPTFYKAIDGVVFPSLLECFSATPLEAMAMERPLFASDRPFNRDVCMDHAHYFDPLSPQSTVDKIAQVFSNGGPDKVALKAASNHAITFSSAQERAEKYLALIRDVSSKIVT